MTEAGRSTPPVEVVEALRLAHEMLAAFDAEPCAYATGVAERLMGLPEAYQNAIRFVSSSEFRALLAALASSPPAPAEVGEALRKALAVLLLFRAGGAIGHASLDATIGLGQLALSALEGSGGWRTINSAPKDGSRSVLVATGTAVGEARYHEDHDGWWWENTHPTDATDGEVDCPTHWMPLPPAPPVQGGEP